MRWRTNRISVQHDWEQYDEPNAAVRLRGAERIAVQHCRFVNTAGTAIRADLHAKHNKILRNEIKNIGGTGIALIGYGPSTRNENRFNEIAGNHISHSACLWWNASGIFVWQSGDNHIHNNLIHNMPYNGITICLEASGKFFRSTHNQT